MCKRIAHRRSCQQGGAPRANRLKLCSFLVWRLALRWPSPGHGPFQTLLAWLAILVQLPHHGVPQSERGDVQEDLSATVHKHKRYFRTNCSKSLGAGLRARLLLALSGLPIRPRWLCAPPQRLGWPPWGDILPGGSNRRGSKKRGGSERGGSKNRSGSERGRLRARRVGNTLRQPAFLHQGRHNGFKSPFYISRLPGLGSGHKQALALNQCTRFKYPGGKSAIRACWASRSLTIFRNGPLFGAMANVKRVSQSAIVSSLDRSVTVSTATVVNGAAQ